MREIEKEPEFTDFLASKIKAVSSYLTYTRNASEALNKPITINDFDTIESLDDHLSELKTILSSDDYSNSKSALKKYYDFAQQNIEINEDSDEIEPPVETDNNVVFDTVVNQHQIAFDFFKTTGTSKQQELLVEYSFLKEIIIQAAAQGKSISISRSDFDSYGFDLLLGMDDKVLQVQMKAYNGKAAVWDVHQSLLRNSQGRVVVAHVQLVDGLMQMRYKMLKKDCTSKALARPPKNKKIGRCKVVLGDLDDITVDLLQLFD